MDVGRLSCRRHVDFAKSLWTSFRILTESELILTGCSPAGLQIEISGSLMVSASSARTPPQRAKNAKVNPMKSLFFTLLASVFFFSGSSFFALATEPSTDSLETIKKNIDEKKAVLIDVRELNEWNDGHLKVASHFALKKIREEFNQAEFDKIAPADKIVYLHCASGFRSIEAAAALEGRHKDLRPLRQGYKALLKAGFPKSP